MTDFSTFWHKYPKDLCHNKKGSKFTAEKAWNKLKPEEQERCLFDMNALIKYDRQDKDAYRWPMCSTFLNQRYWERDIDPVTEREPQELKKCTECDQPTIGPRYSVCAKHTESHAARLKMMQILKQIGVATPGQSLQELSQSCREYLLTSGASGKLLEKMTSSLKPADSGNL